MGPGTVAESAFERVGIAAAASVVPALMIVHAVNAAIPSQSGPHAKALSIAIGVIALVHAVIQWRRAAMPIWSWAFAPSIVAALLAWTNGDFAGVIALVACGTLQGWFQARLARSLPSTVDGMLRRHPVRSIAWSLLVLLAIVQTVRLSNHEADPSTGWWVVSRHPAWTAHQCSSAYIYAADLHIQGEPNIYLGDHYSDGPAPTVENLSGNVDCAYQYPPPFLLLPWVALQLTNDYFTIRPIWLALQGLGFLATAALLGLWVGGPRGRLVLWLLPAVWIAAPTLQNFQFGQYHLSAFALALGGMLAFEKRRTVLGGALLGAAVVTKIYPAVLLVLLVAQRRWRELGFTVFWIVGIAGLGLAILGPAPYEAFVFYHLPRVLDGSAFPSPNADDGMTAILTGITAMPGRLRILGLDFLPQALGSWLGYALGLAILALVWLHRNRTTDRGQDLVLWFVLLNLVVMQGGAAFVDYAPATTLWLLTLLGYDATRSRFNAVWLVLVWIQLATLLGTFPIPDKPDTPWGEDVIRTTQVAAASVLVTIFLLWVNFWGALRRIPAENGTLPD